MSEAQVSVQERQQQNKDTAKLIARGTSFSMVGQIVYTGLSYILQLVIARSLGVAAFGLFSLVFAIVILVRPFALAGLDRGALRYVSRLRAVRNYVDEKRLVLQLIFIVAGIGFLVGLAIFIFAGPISKLYKADQAQVVLLLRWIAPAIPFSALLFLLAAMSDGQKKIEYGVLTQDSLQPAVHLALASLFLWLGAGLLGVVTTFTISLALAVLVQLYLLREYFRSPRLKSDVPGERTLLPEVVGFSLPFLPLSVVRQVGNRLEIYLLGFLGTMESVGVFGSAASTSALTAFGLQAVTNIYSAVAAELHAKKEFRQLESVLKMATRWSTVVSLPAVIVIAVFSSSLLALFGDKFASGSLALLILALGQLVNAATGPVGITLNMAGYSRLTLVNNVVALILNVILDWVLILKWGITGAAIGSAVSMALLNLTFMLEVQYLLKIKSYDPGLWRPVLAGGFTYLAMTLLLPYLAGLPALARLLGGSILIGLLFLLFYWPLAAPEDRDIVRVAIGRGRRALAQLWQRFSVKGASLH